MFRFSWRIENFCMLSQKTGKYLDSPDFEIKSLKNKYANIRLYPNGMNEKNFITYKLCLRGSERLENGTVIKFSFIHNNNSVSKNIITSGNKLDLCHSLNVTEIEGMCTVENLFLLQDKVVIDCIIENNHNGDSSSVISCNAKTVLKVENYTFDLPIGSIVTAWERTQIYSKIVSLSQQSDKFRLSIKLEDYLKTTESHIVEVDELSAITTSTSICCQISLMNAVENNVLACDRHVFECGSGSHPPWKIPFSFCSNALSSLSFLRCKILISDGNLSNLECEDPASKKETPSSLCITSEKIGHNLLNRIFEKGILCDVILQVGTNQFSAHKCVLGGVSDVFAAMFDNNMKEKEASAVNITDFNADTVDKMLQFVYTGKIENIEVKSLNELYSAADKYQILELKESCASHIVKTISMDSVCEIFVLADMHQDRVLEQAAFNFVHANRLDFFDSESWKILMEKQLQLAATIMFHICKNPSLL